MRFAIITHRDRREDFADCVRAISPQVDHIVVVQHLPNPNEGTEVSVRHDGGVSLLGHRQEIPNISRMWNQGLEQCAKVSPRSVHEVAVLNDDAIVPPHWFRDVSAVMGAHGAVAGAMTPDVKRGTYLDAANPPLPRMPGFAFLLRENPANPLRLDEQFQWWWGDTDLEWQARETGGVVLVPGHVEHRHPNSTTVGVLAQIASDDRERFVAKWGGAPW